MAPIVIFALWSVSYVVACVEEVASPGKSLDLPLSTPGGEIRLTAKSYSISFIQRTLVATELQLLDPTGKELATAESLTLRTDELESIGTKPFTARLSGVKAILTRNQDGYFEFEKYLPEPEAEAGKIPIHLKLERVTLDIRDRYRSGLLSDRYYASQIELDGNSSNWVASTSLTRPGKMGVASVGVHFREQEGIKIQGSLQSWAANGLVERANGYDLYKLPDSLSAVKTDLRQVSGHFDVFVPKEQAVVYSGKLEAELDSLKYEALSFSSGKLGVEFSDGLLHAQLRADRVGGSLEAKGELEFKNEIRASASYTVDSEGVSTVLKPLGVTLPEGLKIGRITSTGKLSYAERDGFRLSGIATPAWVSYEGEKIIRPEIKVSSDAKQISLNLSPMTFDKGEIEGAIDIDLSKSTISGAVSASSIDVNRLLKKYAKLNTTGQMNSSAQFSGSIDDPKIEIRSTGTVAVKTESNKTPLSHRFEAGGNWHSNKFDLERLVIQDQKGALTASGTYHHKNEQLNLEGAIRNLDIADWFEGSSGALNSDFTLEGSLDRPVLSGIAEGYALSYRERKIPLAKSRFRWAQNRVELDQISLQRGISKLTGQIAFDTQKKSLSGILDGEEIQISDWAQDYAVSGLVGFKGAELSGSLEDPILKLQVEIDNGIVQGIPIDQSSGKLVITKSELTVEELSANGDIGQFKATGKLDYTTVSGSLVSQFTNADIALLSAQTIPQAQLGGKIASGAVSLEFADGKILSGSGSGNVRGLVLNRTALGQGPFQLKYDKGELECFATIGLVQGYFELDKVAYHTETKQLGGTIFLSGFALQDVNSLVKPYLVNQPGQEKALLWNAPAELLTHLDQAEGSVDASISLSGSLENPNLNCETLSVDHLKYAGEDAGKVTATFTRADREWKIEKLSWLGGPGALSVSGTISEASTLELDGELLNIDPAWIKRVVPEFPNIPGRGSISFLATGETKSPVIQASLNALVSFAEPKAQATSSTRVISSSLTTDPASLSANIDTIEIREGQITAQGLVNYSGFQGVLNAKVPFTYPMTIPEKQPLEVTLTTRNPRQLDEIEDLLPVLDPARSEGELDAGFRLSGVKGDLDLSGQVNLRAPSLAFDKVNTYLKNLNITAKIEGDQIVLEGSAESSQNLNSRLEFRSLASWKGIKNGLPTSLDEILDTKISGDISLSDFAIREEIQQRSIESGRMEPKVRSRARLTGKVIVGGTLRDALISTDAPLYVSQLEGAILSALEDGVYTPPGAYSPRLNIGFRVANDESPAQLNVANASFSLFGQGTITGTAAEPLIVSDLNLKAGTIRLPNARIALDDGGFMRLYYRGGSPQLADARLDVDLTGRTNLSARGPTGNVERYDILIRVLGNMLDPDSQRLTATSDPGDLSQATILALLGQSEIFESISSSLNANRFENQLQQALAGIALPVLFDSITNEIAKGVGLDYLSVDYNAFEGANISAAKTIGKFLTLQGRRQLQQQPGQLQKFDIRFIYRPFTRRGSARNISFSIGMDQERPYKISVEYGIRF